MLKVFAQLPRPHEAESFTTRLEPVASRIRARTDSLHLGNGAVLATYATVSYISALFRDVDLGSLYQLAEVGRDGFLGWRIPWRPGS